MNSFTSAIGVLALILASLLSPARLWAAQDEAELAKCLQETDDQRRLACFDELANSMSQPATETPAVSESAPIPDPAPAAKTVEVVPAAAPAAIVVTPTAASPAASTTTAPTSASAPVADSVPEAAAEAPATSVGPSQPEEEVFVGPPQEASGEFTGIVRRVAEQPRGEHVVYLENGQVWQQNEATRYFPVEPGDTVTFKKRMFGGHRLITESGNAYDMKRLR